MSTRAIRQIDIGVSDLGRSVAFYTDVVGLTLDESATDHQRLARLSAGTAVLVLTEVGPAADRDNWVTDDLQKGFRHIGFKVSNTDAVADRVRRAGIPLQLEPLDAEGGVRIAFFPDPDGVMLEVVQGDLQYHRVLSQPEVDDERSQPVPDAPRFDHIALTVEDLDTAIEVFSSGLDYVPIGQLTQSSDPRGFVITYFRSADTVFEVFTFTAPKTSSPWTPGEGRAGFRAATVVGADRTAAGAALVMVGATLKTGNVWLTPDGFPLRVVEAV